MDLQQKEFSLFTKMMDKTLIMPLTIVPKLTQISLINPHSNKFTSLTRISFVSLSHSFTFSFSDSLYGIYYASFTDSCSGAFWLIFYQQFGNNHYLKPEMEKNWIRKSNADGFCVLGACSLERDWSRFLRIVRTSSLQYEEHAPYNCCRRRRARAMRRSRAYLYR